jgi:hypothetical protein
MGTKKMTLNELKNLVRQIIKEEDMSQSTEPQIIFPDWLEQKLERVHTRVGQGSIFAKSIGEIKNDVLKIVKSEPNLDKIANSSGTIQKKVNGVGYDLVISKDNIKSLPNAKMTKVEKEEGNGTITVNAVSTTATLTQFKTNTLTIIVRPAKDSSGNVTPNNYIILSVFPGVVGADKRASEWGDDYYVVLPQKITSTIKENSTGGINKLKQNFKKKILR